MEKKFNAVKEIRRVRMEMVKEMKKDPKSFWARIRAQGDAWREEHAKKKKAA